MENIRCREGIARKQLKDQGYLLQKRTNRYDPYHVGCYRILNKHTGTVESSSDYIMTLEDVEQFVSE